MADIDIVVPTYNQELFTMKCLRSIRDHTPHDYRVVWIDNGSTEASRKSVLSELISHKKYLTIWLNKNYGFVKAVNSGIKAGNSPYVVLQNNDTEVTDGWLERLMKPLINDDRIKASGPLTDTNGSWQGWRNVKKKMLFDMKDLSRFSPNEIPKILHKQYADRHVQVKMIAFFSTLFKREVFSDIGGLDEDFNQGFGDDDDCCMKIAERGGKVVFVPSAFVYHHHRTTFKSIYTDNQIKHMQDVNIKLYKSKHNLI